MKKRIIALLIVCVLLVSLVPVVPTLAYGSSSVDLPRNNVVGETVTVTADATGCQWQVKIGEVWVNISGATNPELALSYAMFANFPGAPVIRCIDASGNAASDEIVVNFVDAVEPATKPAPAPEVITQPVVDAVITEPNGSTPVVQQPVVQQPVVEQQQTTTQTPAQDTAALEQALADAKAADEAAQAAATAAQTDADAKKAVLDAAQAEYDAAAAAVADAQAALDASIVPVEEGQEPAPLDATLSAALSTAQLTAADAEAKLSAAKADYDAVAAVAAGANAAAANTAAAVAAAQAALDAAAATPAVVEETTAPAAPKLKMASFNLAKTTSNEIATVDDTTGGETDNIRVIINYNFEDNSMVAEPYVAELARGSNFSATVPFPTVQGYLPYVGEEQKNSQEINITNIQEPVTIYVVYKPTIVEYTVIHYQQNVDNNDYTVVESEKLSGYTGTEVGKRLPEGRTKLEKDYPGFYSLLYEKAEIGADGLTVIEIYYDRNYYLMNFDLAGGYGTEPIYARYGATLDIPDPTRAGYTFTGWAEAADSETTVTLPTTMPVGGGTYYAKWQAGDTAKVKVVFWGENPDDEEYSYLATGVVNATPGTDYTFANGNTVFLICGLENHTHGEDCVITCEKTEHTEHNADCIVCEHVCNTLDCYSTLGDNFREIGSKPSEIEDNPTTDGVYTYVTYGMFGGEHTHYYLYLGGKWYCNYYSDEYQITNECTHTHTAECLVCEYHKHSAEEGCYSCGMEEHTHTSSCNQTGSGLDSNLWTFVRSETVKVAADGSSVINVYYDRTTFTMTFKEKGNNGDTLATITDKWGADIRVRFENISKANTYFWSMKSNGGDPWTSFMDVMPQENRTYYADPQSGTTKYTATYLGENLAGTGYETLYTVSFTGKSGLQVSKEEFVDIEGFTFNPSLSTKEDASYNGSKFYYDRHHYVIEFYSPTTLLKKTENVAYEAPLNSYYWEPSANQAPVQYEPGSVVFEGWYLNPECTGDKYDFTTHTMPAGKKDGDTTLTLYAKWVPVTHTVEFYLDFAAYEAGTKLSTHEDKTVAHGAKLNNPVPAVPDNGDYVFISWFYMNENGEEVAFDFANMPVNKDLKVYAKWNSNTLKEYNVYFKYDDDSTNDDGTKKGVEIAEAITGSGVAGHTKFFEAKGDEQLYPAFQNVGYFPIITSHTITLDIKDNEKNNFTFWYVQKDAVPYSVYYVTESNYDGNMTPVVLDGKTYYIVADTKTDSDNRKAVVTEKFEAVSGYVPDAYQKRLVVSGADGADNKIVFIYVKDDKHAFYKTTHYIEDVADGEPIEYASSQAKGEIGTTYNAQEMSITGFTYDPNDLREVKSGVLTADGLELKLYYKRNLYPYEVRYLEEGTGKVLHEPKTGEGKYGTNVTEKAIDITNYHLVSKSPESINIKIEQELTEGQSPTFNIIVFYYAENEVTINYEVVGPSGCGTVTPATDKVKVYSGTAVGSTPIATTGYKFVGWFTDKECEHVVAETDGTKGDSNHFTPAKEKGETVNDPDYYEAATFYAKFEYEVTTLTIKKSGAQNLGTGYDGFIFEVTDSKNNHVATVAVSGDGSTTIGGLKVGETYTVSEVSTWSSRYSCEAESVTLVPNGNEVTMENSYTPTNLLTGSDSVTNRVTRTTN